LGRQVLVLQVSISTREPRPEFSIDMHLPEASPSPLANLVPTPRNRRRRNDDGRLPIERDEESVPWDVTPDRSSQHDLTEVSGVRPRTGSAVAEEIGVLYVVMYGSDSDAGLPDG
jgi:hypothetical protein